jgi:hypothetical protein
MAYVICCDETQRIELMVAVKEEGSSLIGLKENTVVAK